MRLKDQVAIVTGGSQGIGEAIARRYAAEGAKVAIVNRTAGKGEAIADSIRKVGGDARAFAADLSKVTEIDRAVAAVTGAYGAIDILVNNAGAYFLSEIGSTKEDEFDAMLATNIKGVSSCAKRCFPSSNAAEEERSSISARSLGIRAFQARPGTVVLRLRSIS